jgi:hypothetical protein
MSDLLAKCMEAIYMSGQNQNPGESNVVATDGDQYTEAHLRGDGVGGAEQRDAVGHTEYEESRNPDSELRLDGEDETLYSDGIDTGDDTETLMGTDAGNVTGAKG